MKATTMRSLRQWHHYLGVFFAPLIILFAVSGALQTFRLQESRGYGGTPPAWIVWFASIHKNQAVPRDNADPPKAAPTATNSAPAEKPKGAKHARSFALQLFVTAMAIALTLSTLLGVIIALNNRAMRRTSIALLVTGAILPIVLLKL